MAIDYHEPPDQLSPQTRDLHRALSSLAEELEAIDWYQHRIDVTGDDTLRALLVHNRDEEMEHAAMMLEWLRRQIPEFEEKLRMYLFSEGSIVRREDAMTSGDGPQEANLSLGIGSLHRVAGDG
ncbi:MAG: ferritin-like domain-containing protein [Candidatus Hydrogenedentales bacterium]